MNSVNIIGKVTDDVYKSTGSSGIKLARLKLAVEKTSKEQDGNNAEVFEVVVFKDLAEMNYEVGQLLAVSGRVSSNNYEKDGRVYYNCSIVGNSVNILS